MKNINTFKGFLIQQGYSVKSVNSHLSRAKAVETLVGVSLDEIVIDDELMYKYLLEIKKYDDSKHGYLQNSLRIYYLFTNKKEFPVLKIVKTKIFMLNKTEDIIQKFYSDNFSDLFIEEEKNVNELKKHVSLLSKKESELYISRLKDYIYDFEKKISILRNDETKFAGSKKSIAKVLKKIALMILNSFNHFYPIESEEKNNEREHKNILLFVTANPTDLDRIRTDIEFAEINKLNIKANYHYEIRYMAAVTKKDLEDGFLEYKPDIIHFSGHGDKLGLALEGAFGRAVYVDGSFISQLLLKKYVDGIYFNACFSTYIIDDISTNYYTYAIGNNDSIVDEVARQFAIYFYENLFETDDSFDSFNKARDSTMSYICYEYPSESIDTVCYYPN